MNKLPLTEDVANTWATIISLSGHNFKAERDNREMEKTPMASSTLTVESEGTASRLPLLIPECLYQPRRKKTGLRGFRPGPTQTGLYNNRRWLEA